MKIKITLEKGKLKKEVSETLYDALRKIDCESRANLIKMTFEIEKEYVFSGSLGKVNVTFTNDDMID